MEQEFEEMLDEEMVSRNLHRIVNEYFEDRDDTSIFAIGKAASKIIKGYAESSNNVSFHSIVAEENGKGVKAIPQGTHVKGRKKPKTGFYEVELDEQSNTANLKNGMALSIMFKIRHIVVKRDHLARPLSLVCEQIISAVPRSMSYVLISAFGGDFAEKLHRAMARMLMSRGLQVMNLVILPAKFEKQRRLKALKGIIGLNSEVGNVVVYDNNDFVEKEKELGTDFSFVNFDAINNKITRDLGYLIMRLGEKAALIRGKFE